MSAFQSHRNSDNWLSTSLLPVATYYTPLIIKETAQKFIQTINSEHEPVIITDAQAVTVEDIPQEEEVEVLPADSEDDLSRTNRGRAKRIKKHIRRIIGTRNCQRC